jgi:signal transduction histidine kinase/ActR/RegA family two-component response regulator
MALSFGAALGMAFLTSIDDAFSQNNQQLLPQLGGTINRVVDSGLRPTQPLTQPLPLPQPVQVLTQPVQQLAQPLLPNVPNTLHNIPQASGTVSGIRSMPQLRQTLPGVTRSTGGANATLMAPETPVADAITAPPVFSASSNQALPGVKIVAPEKLQRGTAARTSTMEGILTRADRATKVSKSNGVVDLDFGRLFVSVRRPANGVVVQTPGGKVFVKRDADAIVSFVDGVLRVKNLDGIGDAVRVTSNSDRSMQVAPGFELATADRALKPGELRPADNIARRNPVLVDDGAFAVSEISLPSVLKNNELVSGLRNSGAGERKISDRLMKMAAILSQTRNNDGFEIVPAATSTVGDVVQSIASVPGRLLGEVLGNVPVPPVVPPGSGPNPGSGGTPSAPAPNVMPSPTTGSAGTSSAGLLAAAPPANPSVPTDQTRFSHSLARVAPINPNPRAPGKGADDKSAPSSQLSQQESHTPQLIAATSPIPAADPAKSVLSPDMVLDLSGSGRAAQPGAGDNSGATLPETPFGAAGHYIRGLVNRYTEAFVFLLLLIIVLLTAAVIAARTAVLRARELKATNQQLQSEISERRLAENKIGDLNTSLEQRMSELATLNAELQSARDAAIEASRLKSEFVANISHEIRTPVTAVLGMNDMLLETKLTKKQKEYAHLVRESASGLLTVINDILDFSKIEAGKLALESVDFSPRHIVDEVIEMLGPSARAKGLTLTASMDDSAAPLVNGDPARLRQILLNLTANAIKFTSDGGIAITAGSHLTAAGQIEARFFVKDTGIGIPKDLQEKLFQPFVQADGSTTRRYGGTGLGLSISKNLAELMRGNMGVESEPGVGSNFWFTALFDPPAEPDPVADSRTSSTLSRKIATTSGGVPLILVAEDSPVLQKMVGHQLEKLGYKADFVANGAEAVAAAATKPYAAILMDWQMPVMDGLEATRQIRANQSAELIPEHQVPIIAMTANAMLGDRETCIAAGMSDYISKPFTNEQLQLTLETWIPTE